jgi:hypothetical protein
VLAQLSALNVQLEIVESQYFEMGRGIQGADRASVFRLYDPLISVGAGAHTPWKAITERGVCCHFSGIENKFL